MFRMCHSTGTPLAVALLVLFGASASLAKGPPRVRLVYDRAASAQDCPDTDRILDAVRTRLGFDPFREPVETVVRAAVFREGDRLRAVIALGDGADAGERQLVSDRADCDELASTMALALSIAIDPLSISRAVPAAAPRAASRQPSPPPERSPPPAAEPATGRANQSVCAEAPVPNEPRRKIAVQPSVGMLAGYGRAPSVVLGFSAGAGVRIGAWSLSLEGRADLPGQREAGGGKVKASMLVGAFASCLWRGPLGGCALAEVGAVRGSGEGLDDVRQVSTSFAALGARILFEAPESAAVGWRAYVDLTSPLIRTTLTVGGQEAWSTPAVLVSAGLALVASFE